MTLAYCGESILPRLAQSSSISLFCLFANGAPAISHEEELQVQAKMSDSEFIMEEGEEGCEPNTPAAGLVLPVHRLLLPLRRRQTTVVTAKAVIRLIVLYFQVIPNGTDP